MTDVTFDPAVGGDGSSFNDGSGPGGMAEGGYLDNFFPLLVQYLAVAAFIVGKAGEAADYAASALNSPGTSATTTSSITVGTGSKSFTLAQTGKAFVKGQRIRVASDANVANFIEGPITAFNSGTGATTINADSTGGSGTFSDGIVSLGGGSGVPATRQVSTSGLATGGGDLSANLTIDVPKAAAADVRAMTNDTKAITAKATADAAEVVTLQFGASITTSGDANLDMAKFIRGEVTLTADAVLPNPVNAKAGMSGCIAVIQGGAAGFKLTFGGNYRPPSVIRWPSTPGAKTYLYFDVFRPTEIVISVVNQ